MGDQSNRGFKPTDEVLSIPLDLETKDDNQDQDDYDTGKDTVEIKKTVDEAMKAVNVFREKNDARLKEVEAKFEDVVTKEQLDKINAAIDDAIKKLDEMRLAEKRPAIEIDSKDGKRQLTEDEVKHRQAFESYFRKGHEDGLRDLEAKALSVGTDPDGGYTVPVEMEAGVDRIVSEVSPIRAISRVVNISTAAYTRLVNTTGKTSGWVGETAARTETNTSTLSELRFPVFELYAEPRATQSVLDDSAINLETWLSEEVGIEFAEEEGAAFVGGNGVDQPKGFTSYATVANGTYSPTTHWGSLEHFPTGVSGGLATSEPLDVFVDAVFGMKAALRNGARWLMNKATQGEIRKVKDGEGNYIWQPNFQSGQAATILGYPVTEAEDMDDLSTASGYPIAFGNFNRGYLIVDRVGIRVLRDPFTAKPYVKFYTTKRVGGGVQHFEAIKLIRAAAS